MMNRNFKNNRKFLINISLSIEMMKNLILFIAFFLCIACSDRYSLEMEAVLKQAGDNRKELANVLKHYSQDPADSLKLRAAEFLIVNMPGKYSEYYDAPWNDVATVCLRWTSSSDKQMVLDRYGLGEPVIKQDVEYITVDYLINNIELAFKVWREQPWGKHIAFETFCEEILPYRVDTEPLENWREKALASFADLNRSFREDTTVTAVTAYSKVNDLLPLLPCGRWAFLSPLISRLNGSIRIRVIHGIPYATVLAGTSPLWERNPIPECRIKAILYSKARLTGGCLQNKTTSTSRTKTHLQYSKMRI
jgi:hypothetical protein